MVGDQYGYAPQYCLEGAHAYSGGYSNSHVYPYYQSMPPGPPALYPSRGGGGGGGVEYDEFHGHMLPPMHPISAEAVLATPGHAESFPAGP